MRSREDCPVIVDALRTPIGTIGGALRRVDAKSLLAPVLAELARRCAEPIDEVAIGNIRGCSAGCGGASRSPGAPSPPAGSR